ncbi:hypothetical protein E6R18_01540 [Streptomyces sp. A1277]|uniref:hypothetical protein n=1 Tax=Streptomyces sp. A1277 TaxID=2563103 RepID=UPI0010A29CCA|nr:hypothetical protein [Streptomyces sp. A1277]THA36068.1 hypothetical protein E6R18_01540 [Streptomyces sp. A1277]
MRDWSDFEWVVWRLGVQDPQHLAGGGPGLAERTHATMTDLSGSLGCVYEHCVDTDTYPDETPYYAWWVRLPAAEHARRHTDGLPQALHPLREYLTTQLPDGLKWEITPDREYTLDQAGSSAMRTAYDGLIAPFERALMPLRRDGADALDPRAKVWQWEEDLLVGTFDLWLCNDPNRLNTWLVVTVGLWTEPHFSDEEPAHRMGSFGFTPHHPLLLLPRPPGPVTFTARAESGPFSGKNTSRTKEADAIGTAHQWTATDPDVLAERVARDLQLLWPHLTTPKAS